MVGASAGGLEALTALLKALPANTGLAFVLIQHLEPTHPSALTKILSQSTKMPIREVVDGVAVEQNHIYVIPPNKSMTIRQGILRLTAREKTSAPHQPIDTFVIALSEDQEASAIGVVLSGTGSDGTLGLKAIKAAGGITFAQDLSPKRIAAELARFGRRPYRVRPSETIKEDQTGEDLPQGRRELRTQWETALRASWK